MLVLAVFPRSRLSLLYENDNRVLFEMASTVTNGNDGLRKEKLQLRMSIKLHQKNCLTIIGYSIKFCFISLKNVLGLDLAADTSFFHPPPGPG